MIYLIIWGKLWILKSCVKGIRHYSLRTITYKEEIKSLKAQLGIAESQVISDEVSEHNAEPEIFVQESISQVLHSEINNKSDSMEKIKLFIPKACISQKALNHLKRLAAFKNPEFYKARPMRMPTFEKPRHTPEICNYGSEACMVWKYKSIKLW